MSKYNNKKVVIDGIKFDSGKEGEYYLLLKDRLANGEISNLQRQVKYELVPAIKATKEVIKHLKCGDKIVEVEYVKQRAVNYVADFVYTDNATGEQKVVDVKSAITAKNKEYILKKKMMLAFRGIELTEIIYGWSKNKKVR